MQKKNIGNKVSDQSKLWMEEALLKLLQTEKYEEITISEITDHAELSRRTFYRNFSSKDEILEGCFNKIWDGYVEMVFKAQDLSMPNVARMFFTEMRKHLDFLLLMNQQKLLPIFLSQADLLLPPTFYEVKGDKIPFTKNSIEYALTFSIGGFMRILIKWLDEGAVKSPDEMASIIKDMIAIGNFPFENAFGTH